MGHVSRCSAVAAALDVPVRCLAYDAPEPFERDGIRWEPFTGELDADVALIDGYRFEDVASMARTVAIFHDGGPVPDVALVIAPIAGGGLTGLEYACLRRVFWDLPPHAGGGGVLVTTGAGAEGDELAERVAAALVAGGEGERGAGSASGGDERGAGTTSGARERGASGAGASAGTTSGGCERGASGASAARARVTVVRGPASRLRAPDGV